MLTISEEMKRIFNAMREGILIIDTDGVILFGNEAYHRFLNREGGGEDIGDIAGYYLRDLRPGARLPDVLKTGKPILQEPRREVEDIYFVNMYPIFAADGVTLLGGLSVVTFMEDATTFREMMRGVERRGRQMLQRISKAGFTFHGIVARGERSVACKEYAQRIAGSDAPVLLTGESGVGKDVYAQAIHNAGGRGQAVFAAINCATFNPETLDSELFGYVDGAFPGARTGGKIGLFEAVNGGTLLLDEISEMKPETQSKLLRTLQDHTIRPVGGVSETPVDVRIIATSSADLEQCIREGRFRADLYYRLNIFPIMMPSLAQRKSDIILLAEHFIDQLNVKYNKHIVRISPGAIRLLMNYAWPGNVRELENCMERAVLTATDECVRSCNLPPSLQTEEGGDSDSARRSASGSLEAMLAGYERETLSETIRRNKGNLSAAGRQLGISPRMMNYRMNEIKLKVK